MNKQEKLERSEHAKRLLEDDIFVEALSEIRTMALMELEECDAADMATVTKHQALAKATYKIKEHLEALILATGELDGGYSPDPDSPKGGKADS